MKLIIKTNSSYVMESFIQDPLEGVNITYENSNPLHRNISPDDLIKIVISTIASIPASILSAWIINKIRGSASEIYIENEKVPEDENTLTREIEKTKNE